MRLRIVVGAVLVVPLLLVGGAIVVLNSIGPAWPRPVAGVRLESKRPVLRENAVTARNGFFHIGRLPAHTGDLLTHNEDEWTEFDKSGYHSQAFPRIEAWLTRNAQVLEYCRRAAACADSQVPTIERFGVSLYYLPPARAAVRGLCFTAEGHAAVGEWAAMTADVRVALAVAQAITRGGPLINALVGINWERLVYHSVRRITVQRDVPPAALHELLRMLQAADETREPMAEALRYEAAAGLHAVDLVLDDPQALELLGGGTPDPGMMVLYRLAGSSRKRTRAHLAALYSHAIHAAETGEAAVDQEAIKGFLVSCRYAAVFGLSGRDPLGKVMAAMLIPSLARSVEIAESCKVSNRAAQIFAAIAGHENDHGGTAPVRLADLEPEYFTAVPTDPFRTAGEPLRYARRAAGWIVYSVGANGIDDGGSCNELDSGTWREPDICFPSARFQRGRTAP